jgi:glycosyltransferase involved in cell wall biosynthesis
MMQRIDPAGEIFADAVRPAGGGIVVGIPSAGRRAILASVVPLMARQTRQPDEVVICVPSPEDIDLSCLAGLACPVRVLISERGSCRQRNHILDNVPDADVVLFLDDDFLLEADYVAKLERLFGDNPGIALATGRVIADGILGPGISVEDGLKLLAEGCADATPMPVPFSPTYNGYGCNMAVRMSAVSVENVRFDENLPLYGWLEDVDFSRILARQGDIVHSTGLRGVHLGTKLARTAGLRLGYSQVANPVYLMRKDTMSFRHAATQVARNVMANLVKSWRPEPWVDRKGRLMGNVRAFIDLATGRLVPRNVEKL